MAGAFVHQLILYHAYKRVRQKKRAQFFLYLDECHNYINDNVKKENAEIRLHKFAYCLASYTTTAPILGSKEDNQKIFRPVLREWSALPRVEILMITEVPQKILRIVSLQSTTCPNWSMTTPEQDITELETPPSSAGLQPLEIQSHTMETSHAEEQILKIFQNEELSERLRQQLREVIQGELSKMSTLLREAIRSWILQEKSKYKPGQNKEKLRLMDQQLSELQEEKRALEEKNQKLERQIKLRGQENALILDSLKQMMKKKNS